MLVNVVAPFLFCFSFVFVCFVWEYREVGKAVAKIIALALDLDANFFISQKCLERAHCNSAFATP